MAIAYRAGSSATQTTGSLTITIPATVQPGDLLVLVAALNDAGVPEHDWSTPSGWTLRDARRVGTNLFGLCAVRVATSGDASSTVTLSTPATGKSCAIVVAYSGVDTASPINAGATASETVSTETHTTPAINTTVADCVVIAACVTSHSVAESWSTASGHTKRVDVSQATGFNGQTTGTLQDIAAPTIGAYGGAVLTSAGASPRAIMYSLALQPTSTTQTITPTADVESTDVEGVPTPGGGSGIYARVGAGVDTEYAQFADGGVLEVSMSDPVEPASTSGHVIQYRARYSGGASAGDVTVRLMQGATQIASWVQALTDTFADYEHTVATGDVGNITDYSDLRVEIVADAS
jgi:hypothetical protein